MKYAALLALLALPCASCQDHPWAENDTPVCNQTSQTTLQSDIKKLDILFVIDNSGTMREEQDNLADNFSWFVDELLKSDADYQLGIVTTDVENGKGELFSADGDPDHKIINQEDSREAPQTPGGFWNDTTIASVFAANIKPPQGSDFEKGLEAMRPARPSRRSSR